MFEVIVKKRAEKFALSADKGYRGKILEILDELETDPIPFKTRDVKRMEGFDNRFRIRKGRIRIVYEVSFSEFKVTVHDIDFRGSIY